MKRLLPAIESGLEADLILEQGGHRAHVRATGLRVTLSAPNLSALLHFGRVLWPMRKLAPRWLSVHLAWGPLRVPVKRAS